MHEQYLWGIPENCPCIYVRLTDNDKWEYGVFDHQTRKRIKRGTKNTREDAEVAIGMGANE